MTRKKVDPDKRRRVAQACDACKRSKLKCDGLAPCKTCSNRTKPCTYESTENGPIEETKTKRRRLHSAHNARSGPVKKDSESPNALQDHPQSTSGVNGHTQQPNGTVHFTSVNGGATVYEDNEEEEQNGGPDLNHSVSVLSRGSTVSGKDEEAVVFNSTRMLQDPSGRLLYIGDSGTLSFLSILRMIVENVAGPSPFTVDPQRLRIVENPIGLPSKIRLTRLLPDKRTADILLEAYFVNTNGLVEVFNRKDFMTTYENCYVDPLGVEPSWLCLLYLAFAIGFVMAAPLPKSPEYEVIQKLRADPVDQGEVFYSNAKQLADPSRGFEDEDFWSIQALTLMTLYTLSISKRNAAYAYFGMAVRSAFALGLHRGETMCIFLRPVQSLRRNLWRSLFVLDRFLASCLGRPTAIRESDCSGDTFTTPEMEKPDIFATVLDEETASSIGLEASVRSCHVIGVVLEKVYSQRKVSTKLAQEIVDDCGTQKELHPSLHFRQVASPNTQQGVAILHVNLLFYHSILLLTRPFFLFLMHRKHDGKGNEKGNSQQSFTRMEHFGRYCVVVSCQSIAIIQSALASRFLPRRNPFVIYFLLASALIVLANEFSSLYQNPYAKIYIRNAIDIMQYCSKTDPQARRLMFILTEFREVVDKQQAATSKITMQPFGHHTSNNPQINPSVPITSSIVETHTTTSTIHTILNPNQADLINPPRSQAVISPSTQAPAPLLQRTASNPNMDPLVSLSQTSGPSILPQPNPLETMNYSYFANYHSPSNSDPQNQEPMILPLNSRQNSLDLYLDLSLLSGNAVNIGNDMEADLEVDFEKFWNWQSTGSGFTPGGALGGAIAREHAMNGTTATHGGSDAQRPMYGATNGNFNTNPNFQGFG